jgi:hypothetical protein
VYFFLQAFFYLVYSFYISFGLCRRWVTVSLGGFGETSTVAWCSGPGDRSTQKLVALPRLPMGKPGREGCVLQGRLVSGAEPVIELPGISVGFGNLMKKPCAVVNLFQADAAGETNCVQFQSVPGTTPAPLLAALASLAWPPHSKHTYDQTANAYVILRELGRLAPAFKNRQAPTSALDLHDELTLIRRGFIELCILPGDMPGQLSQDSLSVGLSVVVPPGIAEGAWQTAGTFC